MAKIKEGIRVKGKVEGKWYVGEVAKVYSSGKVKVNFDDGDVLVLAPEDVKISGSGKGGGASEKIQEGTPIKAKVDGPWYAGEVAKILSTGKIKVNFDDGDQLVLLRDDIKVSRGGDKKEKKDSTPKIKDGSQVSYKKWVGEIIGLNDKAGTARVRWDDDGKSEWMHLDDLKLVDLDWDWGERSKKYNFRECTEQVSKIMGKRDLAPSEMVNKMVAYADKNAAS